MLLIVAQLNGEKRALGGTELQGVGVSAGETRRVLVDVVGVVEVVARTLRILTSCCSALLPSKRDAWTDLDKYECRNLTTQIRVNSFWPVEEKSC